MKTILKKLPHSEVEIEGEIPADILVKQRKDAVKKLQKEIRLDGFRDGNIPESILVSRVGEAAILEEAAEIVLKTEYEKIILEHKLETIGRPQIILTKIVAGSPATFKIRTAVMPEIKVADYKHLAAAEMSKKEKVAEVTEKDVDRIVEELRKMRQKTEAKDAGAAEEETKKDAELPAFDDAFVKTLGDFSSVSDFREKAKKNLEMEAGAKARDKRRLAIVEKIVESSKIDLPEILVQSEIEKMFSQLESDIERAGVKMKDYLEHVKKSEDDIRKDLKQDAEKRAKIQLIFNEIAKTEKLVPDKKKIETESAAILEHYKEAKLESVKIYVTTILTNDLVFEFLERQK